MDYIYFCRSSLCIADDVAAPNMQRFEYLTATLTEDKIKEYITKYLSYLSFYKWDGYCNGEFVCSFYRKDKDDENIFIIVLCDNWKTLLEENRVIWFIHCTDPEIKDSYIRESKTFTVMEAEEIYEEYPSFAKADEKADGNKIG